MNIILIISDTFRYDNLFDRASMPVSTPNLDAFAGRAVSLEGLYTGSFPTIPHRTDLTTGRFGWPWYPWQNLANSSRNNLPDLLRSHGYVSQLICDCPHLFNAGFQNSFSAAMTLRGQEGDMPFLWMNHPIEEVMPPEKTRPGARFLESNLADLHGWTNRLWRLEEDRFPPRTARTAVEWLEENYRHDSFFLWVDFFDPHEPWDPPEYMVRKYDPDYAGPPMVHPNYGRASDLTPEELQNLRAHYCAEAELVDRWVGRVLQKIDDLALWEKSIVIFTTDHGMSLGEHNRTGKSNINDGDDRFWPVYPEVAHIPFLIAAPGLSGGRSVEALVQPCDILPTVSALAGIEPDPPEPFHGRSIAGLLKGETDAPIRDIAVSASFARGQNGAWPDNAVTPVVYTGDWAYAPVGAAGEKELYDTGKDPAAETNVAGDHADVARDLHDRLIGWCEEVAAPAEAVDLLR